MDDGPRRRFLSTSNRLGKAAIKPLHLFELESLHLLQEILSLIFHGLGRICGLFHESRILLSSLFHRHGGLIHLIDTIRLLLRRCTDLRDDICDPFDRIDDLFQRLAGLIDQLLSSSTRWIDSLINLLHVELDEGLGLTESLHHHGRFIYSRVSCFAHHCFFVAAIVILLRTIIGRGSLMKIACGLRGRRGYSRTRYLFL